MRKSVKGKMNGVSWIILDIMSRCRSISFCFNRNHDLGVSFCLESAL